jgi:hypothetical protein
MSSSRLIIATGCYTNIPKAYPGAISISCSVPRQYGNPPAMPELAPRGFKNDPTPVYVPKYQALLKRLDAKELINKASGLAYQRAKQMGMSDDDAAEVVPVLLCWERPGQFCHRRLFADWIKREVELYVPEVKFVAGQIQPVAARSNLARPPAVEDQLTLL